MPRLVEFLFGILMGIEEEITWLSFEPIKWNVGVMALHNFWPFIVIALLCIA